MGNNAPIDATGTQAITISARTRFAMSPGTRLSAVDGDITISANQDADPTGNFAGIFADGGLLRTTGTGTITLTATGGSDAASGGHRGIHLIDGSIVENTGSGDSLLNGTGGAGTNDNQGIQLAGSGTVVRSASGVSLVGTGAPGSTASSNHGVSLVLSAAVTSTGFAPIFVDGVGGGGEEQPRVEIGDVGAGITTVSGDINVIADTTDGTSQAFVLRNNAGFTSTGGNITVMRTPSPSGIERHRLQRQPPPPSGRSLHRHGPGRCRGEFDLTTAELRPSRRRLPPDRASARRRPAPGTLIAAPYAFRDFTILAGGSVALCRRAPEPIRSTCRPHRSPQRHRRRDRSRGRPPSRFEGEQFSPGSSGVPQVGGIFTVAGDSTPRRRLPAHPPLRR